MASVVWYTQLQGVILRPCAIFGPGTGLGREMGGETVWTSTSMTVGESVLTSVMGFFIVFAMLAFLAIVILIFAKVAGAVSGKGSKQPAPVAAAPAVEDASEKIAIMTSVLCEELNAYPNELVIKGIREV